MTKHIKTNNIGGYAIDFYKTDRIDKEAYFYEIKKDDDIQECVFSYGDFENIADASIHALDIFKQYYNFIGATNNGQ